MLRHEGYCVDSTKLLDLDYLLEMSGDDYDFVIEVLETFTDCAPALIEDLQRALKEGNGAAATHAAHTLKGSSRSIGAEPFAAMCQEIEHGCRTESFGGCIEIANRLPIAYRELLIVISQVGQRKAA